VSVLLALAAAASYGLADFNGGVFSKRASAWAVSLAAQIGGTLATLLVAVILGGAPDGGDFAWAGLAGIGNGFGTAFLYRGLASGRMGVVAPISGVAAVILPVVVGLGTGERPAVLVWAGVALAFPAIWLVSREPGAVPLPSTSRGSDAVLNGLVAGLGFGLLFVALAQIPEDSGYLPLALNQAVAAVLVVIVASAFAQPWVPRTAWAWGGAISGVLGALATGLFLAASQRGFLSVAAVITSLYPAFTVLLAAGVLRERVHRTQALGLALCAGAVVMVALG
jgi:drug/metabolite transporter (DMT)-like permease